MAGQRQPTDLVVMKGKKHLTKAEIEARKNAEVVAPNDKVKPPAYLTPEQKKKFRKLSKELLAIKLIANVDCDALARLLIAQVVIPCYHLVWYNREHKSPRTTGIRGDFI